MSLVYVIDAYNLINNPAFSKIPASTVTESRIRLAEFIRTARPCGNLKANRAILVFDGYGEALPEGFSGIEVVFSQEEDADLYIKQLLEKAKNTKNIIVVSDDKEVRSYGRLFRSSVLAVADFMALGKSGVNKDASDLKPELTYLEAEKINRELRDKWL